MPIVFANVPDPVGAGFVALGVRLNEHLEHEGWAARVRAGMPHGPRRDRVEAKGFVVPLRAHERLVEGQEPEGACGDAVG
jgi:hypothetical protein